MCTGSESLPLLDGAEDSFAQGRTMTAQTGSL